MFQIAEHKHTTTLSMPDVDRFRAYCSGKHEGKKRKDGTPYFPHCIRVGDVAKLTLDEIEPGTTIAAAVVQCAGYGHDLYEDTDTDYEDVVKEACDEAAMLIAWVSDDKRLPSEIRHRVYCRQLLAAPVHAQVVKVADLDDNSKDSILLAKSHPSKYDFLRRWHGKATDMLNALAGVQKATAFARVRSTLVSLDTELNFIREVWNKNHH